MTAHVCPDCRQPTQYQPYTGGRDWYCPVCDTTGPYPPGTAPRRVELLRTPEGRAQLVTEMRAELARRADTMPARASGRLVDQLTELGAKALAAAAYECEGDCGLSESACYEAHPVNFSAQVGGETHVDGPASALARTVIEAIVTPGTRLLLATAGAHAAGTDAAQDAAERPRERPPARPVPRLFLECPRCHQTVMTRTNTIPQPDQPLPGHECAPPEPACPHGPDTPTWFDRAVCPPPCDAMHTRYVCCGAPVDSCP